MDHDGFEVEAWAAFRLSWPGNEAAAAPRPQRGLASLLARLRDARACTGWPVRLAVPGPEVVPPLPKVKLTGSPLD